MPQNALSLIACLPTYQANTHSSEHSVDKFLAVMLSIFPCHITEKLLYLSSEEFCDLDLWPLGWRELSGELDVCDHGYSGVVWARRDEDNYREVRRKSHHVAEQENFLHARGKRRRGIQTGKGEKMQEILIKTFKL